MRIECEKLPERLQRRIAADEQVLWCGKGRPTPFLRGFWPRMMAGCMAAAFLYWTFPDRVLAGLASDGTNLSDFDVWPALVYGFFAVFDAWLLLTPLYYWILSLGTTWVVTNRSVTSFFGPFTYTWNTLGTHPAFDLSLLPFATLASWTPSPEGTQSITEE